MTLHFSVSTQPGDTGTALYTFKTVLVASGWTVPRSGTGDFGSTAASDLITSGGVMNTPNAWFVAQMPTANGVTRQICVQRGVVANDGKCRIKYSYSAGFSGGSPAATTTPTATDEQLLWGGGSNGSPTYTAIFGGTIATNYLHIVADGSAPYGFVLAGTNGTGAPIAMFACDPMIASSYSSLDTDPYVFLCGASGAYVNAQIAAKTDTYVGTSTVCGGYLRKGHANETFLPISGCNLAAATHQFNPSGGSTNPVTGLDDLLPIFWLRSNTVTTPPCGYKGVSRWFRWQTSGRSTGDTMTESTSKDLVVMGDVVFPWDGSTPTV